ncbi:MAG TPA: signal peptidase I [Candidatus Limnocylindrales bacterium]|nr:signal peptidase I [Candidatus Limnocylindrales bacterium]
MAAKSKQAKNKPKPAPAPAGPTTRDKIRRELMSWFWVILAFFIIESMIVQARVIPSASMENTILIGDHLIVSLVGYDIGIPFTEHHIPLWRNPKRQQIIVFEAPPEAAHDEDFIKRVIGVPGDAINISRGIVYVNGKRLNEPYADREPGDSESPVENFPPMGDNLFDGITPEWAMALHTYVKDGKLIVPPREYFVMGDNRDDSNDSRYWGFVPRRNIIGTPLFIYMSIRAPDGVWEPGHIGERLGTYLSVFIHPAEMRWKRLFRTF